KGGVEGKKGGRGASDAAQDEGLENLLLQRRMWRRRDVTIDRGAYSEHDEGDRGHEPQHPGEAPQPCDDRRPACRTSRVKELAGIDQSCKDDKAREERSKGCQVVDGPHSQSPSRGVKSPARLPCASVLYGWAPPKGGCRFCV